jgi:hypothetical protein
MDHYLHMTDKTPIPAHLRLGITKKGFQWFYQQELGFYQVVHKTSKFVERQALVDFYDQHDLSKTTEAVDRTLLSYKGNAAGLVEALREKYGSSIELVVSEDELYWAHAQGKLHQVPLEGDYQYSTDSCIDRLVPLGPSLRKRSSKVNLIQPLVPVTEVVPRSAGEVRSLWAPYREKDQWIQHEFQDKLTSYDVIACTRLWLQKIGEEDKSVCEVLQERHSLYCTQNSLERKRREILVEGKKHSLPQVGGVVHYYPEDLPIGIATCFISHVQAECPDETNEIFLKTFKKYYWLDITSLRQLMNDFAIEPMIALIQEINYTSVNLDIERNYLNRSFCILEAYATATANGKLIVEPRGEAAINQGLAAVCCCREVRVTVDSASFSTRDLTAREKINEYILKNIGHDRLDEALAHAIEDGIRRQGVIWILVRLLLGMAIIGMQVLPMILGSIFAANKIADENLDDDQSVSPWTIASLFWIIFSSIASSALLFRFARNYGVQRLEAIAREACWPVRDVLVACNRRFGRPQEAHAVSDQ